eukprot:1972624-Amphidinium_carterae.2
MGAHKDSHIHTHTHALQDGLSLRGGCQRHLLHEWRPDPNTHLKGSLTSYDGSKEKVASVRDMKGFHLAACVGSRCPLQSLWPGDALMLATK